MSRPFTSIALSLLVVAGVNSHTAALAQGQTEGPVPLSDTAGALMKRNQYYFFVQTREPELTQPITEHEVSIPDLPKDEIIYQDGILPAEERIQGIFIRPDGRIFITPEAP